MSDSHAAELATMEHNAARIVERIRELRRDRDRWRQRGIHAEAMVRQLRQEIVDLRRELERPRIQP